MDLVFITEARFQKSPTGKIYPLEVSFSECLWQRYLDEFEHLFVMARVADNCPEPAASGIVSGQGRISFIELPYYVGLRQYCEVRAQLREMIRRNLLPGRAYLCRVPGILGATAARLLTAQGLPYGVEVVGDPWEVFAKGGVSVPFRPVFRRICTRTLQRVVRNSAAALYVTQEKLQKTYPVRSGCFSTAVSNVIIPASYLDHFSLRYFQPSRTYRLLSIGSLAQLYKGPDIALQAVKILKQHGISITLVWLGDGKFRPLMQELSETLGISDCVDFQGSVDPETVRAQLLQTDLYIHPSKTEGLPRAVIEAMAAGLPCIGTRVGGIPELLEPAALVPPNDSNALADKICTFLANPEFVHQQQQRNFAEAMKYREEVLKQRRRQFFQRLKQLAEIE